MARLFFYLYNLNSVILAGSVYLIPVTLGDDNYQMVIPSGVLSLTKKLRHFIVEDIRSARRFLRMIDREFPIDDCHFYVLDEHTRESEIAGMLDDVKHGNDAGIMSEAGLPGVADPGSDIIRLAHLNNIRVIPLSGPSSILLALSASGMNGQNFSFHGYMPLKPDRRGAKLREMERRALAGETQIFMETPYRASKLAEYLISNLRPELRLCIASDITLDSEKIMTKTISEWRSLKADNEKRLSIFLICL